MESGCLQSIGNKSLKRGKTERKLLLTVRTIAVVKWKYTVESEDCGCSLWLHS